MISIRSGGRKSPGATLDEPLDHLSACHRRIEQRLDTLERVIPVLWERREEALRAIRNVFAFLDGSGVLHTEDEELSLFPRLLTKLQSDQVAFVASLEAEHQEAHKLYARLQASVGRIEATPEHDRQLAAEFAGIATQFCALYRRHIQQEDSKLIDLSRALLSREQLAESSSEMKTRRRL